LPVLVAGLTVAGCGEGGNEVTGVVKIDGKETPGVLVTFIPEGEEGEQAQGVTDDYGKFKLSNRKGFKIASGMYKVTIAKSEKIEGPPAQVGESPTDYYVKMAKPTASKAGRTGNSGGINIAMPKALLGPEHNDPAKTPHRAKVPSDGPIVFELKSLAKK
jgi:hypothetical protein